MSSRESLAIAKALAADQAGSDMAELARILLAVAREDRRAFRRLYALTARKLFGICLRICGERQAAEDVLQEVYLIIWRRAPLFDGSRASPIAWLATIARNRAIDWRRGNLRPAAQTPPVHPDAPADEPVDQSRAADLAMIDDEEARKLIECVNGLDEKPRKAIHAAFLEGLTYSELAKREGVPLATMKSTVRRGLLRLRKCLNDDA